MFVLGLYGLLLVNIAYYPLSWIGQPFFICNSEIGCYPRILGRILMIVTYTFAYFLYCKIKKLIQEKRNIK